MRRDEDSICAVATGIGGSITIIRLSGSTALTIANKIWKGKRAPINKARPHRLLLGKITDLKDNCLDESLAVYMPAPHSYTGEDLIEFHCHGGRMVAQQVLGLLMQHGARHAEPGEFSKRAFINDKMDLTQAEAVLDIIQAQSELALRTAQRQREGVLKDKINALYDQLKTLLAEIELHLDFVEEDLDRQKPNEISTIVQDSRRQIQTLLSFQHSGELLRQGLRIVIAGTVNAGKSSLLNRMLGHQRAIVTDFPGTTRDTLEESAQIRGIPVILVDTAGIRLSQDLIEQEGMSRSRASMQAAHLILWVIDSTRSLLEQSLDLDTNMAHRKIIAVVNKIDLIKDSHSLAWIETLSMPAVKISALTGEGIETLYDECIRYAWGETQIEIPDWSINTRHAALLEKANDALQCLLALAKTGAFELMSVQLRSAIDALGKISGRTVSPDILDSIFSRFCIGK